METNNASSQQNSNIVISGIAGKFPESEDMNHLRDNLYNKVDMITDDTRRWAIRDPEIPPRSGKLINVDKFDAGFFGISYKEADLMCPMVRICLEQAVQAIIDAGYHPSELEGTKTAVIVGCSFSETEPYRIMSDKVTKLRGGSLLKGMIRSMIAHRISYYLKLKGPSYNVDTACSSSLTALKYAYDTLNYGTVDRALVLGAHLCLHPYATLQFSRLGVLSKDGYCRVFDINSNGYVRAEAASAILIQKAENARRIYGTLIHADANSDGYKAQSITFPSSQDQKELLDIFYDTCKINPADITYIEAHGTATVVGDPEEVSAIDAVFCKNRKRPLLMGSVKSNLGHAEPASGLNSVAKCIITMENELIPANINFEKNRPGVKPLEEGRIMIVTENTPLPDKNGLIGLSSFGFGGSNCHALLKWNTKSKINRGIPSDDLPRLVICSGRTKDAILAILNYLSSSTLDQELIRLYHQIFSKEFPLHVHRGYTILSKSKEIRRHVGCYIKPKSLYLVFNNYFNNWSQWINELKSLPIFASCLEDILNVLSANKLNIADNKNCETEILGSITLQLALVGCLKAIGVKPKGCFGIGLGEFVCGYFEGCLTLKQTIDCVQQIASTMVTKDLNPTYFVKNDKIELEQLPSGVELIQVHETGVTISGESTALQNFVGNIKNQGIEIEKIENNTMNFQNINFCKIKPQLLKSVAKVLDKPKQRTTTWMSCLENCNQLASAEFFLDSLSAVCSLSKIKKNIDKNAAILEVGDGQLIDLNSNNGLISFNFESLSKSTKILSFFEILGRLYLTGQNLDLALLYPHVEYPVSRGTAMISPSIKFDHSKSWNVMRYEKQQNIPASLSFLYSIDPNMEEWNYVTGHVIDGRNLFPATGYLCLVWQFLIHQSVLMMFSESIVFENVRFERATTVSSEKKLELSIAIQKGTGYFEVVENDVAVVTGRVYVPKDIKDHQLKMTPVECENYDMSTKDIYKELRLRGYNYSGGFKGLHKYNRDFKQALVEWTNNWVTFMDNMLQIQILNLDSRNLFVPTFIRQISIDVGLHSKFTKGNSEEPLNLPVTYYKDTKIIKSGGIEIRDLRASIIARRRPMGEAVLEKYQFVPNETRLKLNDAIRVNVQIALENIPALKVKVVELIDNATIVNSTLLGPLIKEACSDLPLIQPEVTILSKVPLKVDNCTIVDRKLVAETECYLVAGTNLLKRPQVFKEALTALNNDGFIMSRQSLDFHPSQIQLPNINILTIYTTDSEQLILVRKSGPFQNSNSYAIDVSDIENFTWLTELQKRLKAKESTTLYLQDDIQNGILGLINCIRKEVDVDLVQAVLINNSSAPRFKLEEQFYKNQLRKGFAINVLKDSKWGTYRHLQLKPANYIECEHAAVYGTVRGDLSGLKWMQGSLRQDTPCQSDEALVNVYYSALNFRDVMVATGRIYLPCGRLTLNDLGLEFSGRKNDGTRVMGMCESGAITNMIQAPSVFIWPVPNNWSLEEAATVPCVYATVIYAIFIRAKLKRGDSILIHSGTGGIGQAAIRLALHCGCTVFTTVGTQDKREFIKKQFPDLKDSHIGNSRDTSFEQMIYRETNGCGVTMVLNSLAEEKLLASVRCLARNGHFLEIGKFDLQSDHQLNLLFMEKQATFNGIMLDHLMASSCKEKQILHQLMIEGIENGSVQPLMSTVFQENEIEEAFRYMTSGKHMGKVLIKIRNEEKEKAIVPSKKKMLAIPKFLCDPKKVVIILGGLGGFGLELADWLVLRDCRKLVLTSRTGLQTGYQASRIAIWKSYGVKVEISTADITTKEGCRQLIIESQKLGPIESIFNLAVILKDAVLDNQTPETFRISLGPKAYSTKYLDEITRDHCPDLRDFVVFSSVSCGRGNGGQTNYGMANSIMERICEKRKEDGYPALAVEWGAVGDVGIVAEMQEDDKILEIGGTLQQQITNCIEVLEIFLKQNEPVVSSIVVAIKKSGGKEGTNVVETVAVILGIKNLKTISMHSQLSELGMDSMTAVEIRQTLEREFQITLSVQEVRSLTFAKLQEYQDSLSEEDNDTNNNNSGEVDENKTLEGLGMFIRSVISGVTSQSQIIELKSKTCNTQQAPVIIFPGVDGALNPVESFAAKLNHRVFCVQYANSENIADIARDLLPAVAKLLRKDQPFQFIGHSFGLLVALELVKLLEDQGFNGHLISLDGAPEYLCNYMKMVLGNNKNESETNFLSYILSLVVDTEIVTATKEAMTSCKSFNERLEVYEKSLPINNEHSPVQARAATSAVYKRLISVENYSCSLREINTKITLFKPATVIVSDPELSEDYKLSEICKEPVEVRIFNGNHQTILDNLEMADAVNKIFTQISVNQ